MLEVVFAILFLAVLKWVLGRRSHLRLRVRIELLVGVIALLTAAAYIIARRFEGGLGAVSNMSDSFPWGIWIGFDLCGVALAAGGFVLAGIVHIFHWRRFEPILRPMVLTAFIAYQLVAAILVLDLGRPYRFWHPLIMWQPHSVMFEITLCLTLYTAVLAIEFSPALWERLGWHRVTTIVHSIAPVVVIIGVILSTLHQSSFGSLFLIVPKKLHPLWYTPVLPLFFLASAVAAGLAVVMLESRLCSRWLGRGLAPDLIASLGRGCAGVLAVYGIGKIIDVWVRGAWATPCTPMWLGMLWLAEMVIGIVLPAIWMARPARGSGSTRRFWIGPLCVAAGVVLNRLSVSWFGLIPAAGIFYVPHVLETVLVVAFAVAGALAFLALAQVLPVFPEQIDLAAHGQSGE